ncbi:MAG TPA: hypothetical protein VGR78_12085 [Verrucomicrobiae bacterium]|nr:hypothetical protein [Verrucomicrobiae bacterium]
MFRFGVALLFFLLGLFPVAAGEYRLTNGDVLKGEAASFSDDGLVVRLDIGGFSPRTPWGKFTQETLKELMQNTQAKEFVEPYIDIPLEIKEKEKQKKKDIKVAEPPRVPVVEGKIGFFAAMANPLGFTLLGALYLANLYAGVQIARFRGRPVPLVVGVSAIAPIVGPSIFLALPGHAVTRPDGAAAAPEPAATEGVNPMQQALPSGMAVSSLGLASAGHGGKGGGNAAYNQVYTRANTTFDRKFFESKFTGFFRVIPVEPEKDLVIVIKTAKQEFIGTRISRISGSEVHFQLQRGGAEASVPFGEITEVLIRPKGAK